MAGECDVLEVGKMSKDVGMVIHKSIAVQYTCLVAFEVEL